jgi:hypothetical protein
MTKEGEFALARQAFPDDSEVPTWESLGMSSGEAVLMNLFESAISSLAKTEDPVAELRRQRNKTRMDKMIEIEDARFLEAFKKASHENDATNRSNHPELLQ